MYHDGVNEVRRGPRRLMSSSTLLRKQQRAAVESSEAQERQCKRPMLVRRGLSPSASFTSNTDNESDCACYSYPTSRTRPRTTTVANRQSTRLRTVRGKQTENVDRNRSDDTGSSYGYRGGSSFDTVRKYSATHLNGTAQLVPMESVELSEVEDRNFDANSMTKQYCVNCAATLEVEHIARSNYLKRICSLSSSMKQELFIMTSVCLIISLAVVSQMVALGCDRNCKLEHNQYMGARPDSVVELATCIDFPFKSILNSKFVLKRVPWLEDTSKATYAMLQPHPTVRVVFLILAIVFAIAERAVFCYAVLRFAYGVLCRRVLRPLFRVVVTLSVVKFSFLSCKMFFSMMVSGKEGERAWLSPSLAQSIVECLELGELPIDAMIGTVAGLSSRAARSVAGLIQMWLFSS